jgi:SAM-dependent methyltransferase
MTSEAESQFDQAKAEAFAGQFITAVNGASLMALSSLGRHSGLFSAMAGMPASTSQQIADKAGLNERYVREWLGGMVLGGVIDYDPSGKTYYLPPEHAAFLTSEAGPNDLTSLAQFFPYMGLVEAELVQAFRKGGGVPYSSFPNFQEIQAGMTGAFFQASLVDVILPMAAGMIERLQEGANVLDIGCGAGRAVSLLAETFPKSSITGYDFSEEGIGLARKEAAAKGLGNAHFEVADIAAIDEPERYDLVTAFELVHDLARPEQVLAAVYRALKPDGVFIIVDIAASSNLEENYDHPIGPALFTFSVFHCMTVAMAQGGVGLGTAVGEQKITELLHAAGFPNVQVNHVDGDFFYSYYVARKR